MAKSKKTIALVIGSGNIRSLAALPLLEFLEAHQIKVDLIVGSGGGALIGGLYSAGIPLQDFPQHLKEVFKRDNFDSIDYLNTYRMLTAKTSPTAAPPAILKNSDFRKALDTIFGEMRMESLRHPMIIHATEMLTGKPVELSTGLVADNIYASCVIYPFLEPLVVDNQPLAGGVFTAAFPLMTAVKRQMDTIIGVGFREQHKIEPQGFIEYVSNFLNRTYSSTQSRFTSLAISLHDGEIVLVNVKFPQVVKLWDTALVETILESGRQAVEEYGKEILTVLAEKY